jgi:hypothetical protein
MNKPGFGHFDRQDRETIKDDLVAHVSSGESSLGNHYDVGPEENPGHLRKETQRVVETPNPLTVHI